MKRLLVVAALAFTACPPAEPMTPPPEPVVDPLAWANPAMGTGGFAYFHGSAFPGACVPHGLVKAGPDTRGRYGTLNFIHYSGYWSGDDTVMGFSQLHLHGTGATDWGVLSLMPVTSGEASVLNRSQYQSRFGKRSEVLKPGSYEVTLDKWNVKAELTASTHVAHHRYTFADSDTPRVVVDLRSALSGGELTGQTVTLVDDTTLRGSFLSTGGMSRGFGGNTVWFELRTNRAHRVIQRVGDDALLLELDPGSPVEVLVGVSLVSAEGATRNLEAEMPGFDFDAHRAAAEDAWRTRLSRVTVYGGSEEDRATFYSALRLAFLMPTTISDVDGAYVFGGEPGAVASGDVMLSDLSLWDTYRTVHPLYSLVHEDGARQSVQSLARMAGSGRGFPRWPMATGEAGTMVGAPADIVIADAVLRGVPGLDATALYDALRAEALGTTPTSGARAAMGGYTARGWVPVEESGRSVGITVEYAHADWALAQLARQLGKADDAAQLETRARGWRQLFDASLGVLRPRHADGAAVTGEFDPGSWDHYAEANAAQTTFMPSWDLEGFDAVFGSREAFLTSLTAFFDGAPAEHEAAMADPNYELRYLPRRYYWPSNEPDIQAPFLFAQAGRPELTAKWVDWARRTFFSATPDGVPGNDDGGTLGSWFVFAAMGLYPVPGTDAWVVGTPLFPKLDIALPGGGIFTIEARGVSAEAIYVQSATLNGAALDVATLRHADVKAGGSLVLEMGTSPSTWAH